MRELTGKTAVITGGGGGIGRGMALAFGEAGMNVALADIDEGAARKVADEVASRGVRTLTMQLDVVDRSAVESLANRVYSEFGEANLLCNNAGVSTFEPMHALRDEDWGWVLGVNLHGVINGIQAFLPRMKAQPGDAHIVNTASVAGLTSMPNLAPYNASKFAVVAISETLAAERSQGGEHDVGCSVLCPGFVNTGIADSERNRPASYGPPTGTDVTFVNSMLETGLSGEDVGRIVRQAVLDDELYIFTHPDWQDGTEKRLKSILAAFAHWRERLS